MQGEHSSWDVSVHLMREVSLVNLDTILFDNTIRRNQTNTRLISSSL
jgi:hypothetical protein